LEQALCFALALTLALSPGERELRLHGFDLADDCSEIEAVNFYHPDAPFGTGHVDGKTMLELWKKVEKKKASKLVA
jgi:hypothetical protein